MGAVPGIPLLFPLGKFKIKGVTLIAVKDRFFMRPMAKRAANLTQVRTVWVGV